jgi:hypothetical protein
MGLFGGVVPESAGGWSDPVDRPALVMRTVALRSQHLGGKGFIMIMGRHQTSSVISTGSTFLLLLLTTAGVWARPTTPQEAQRAVAGWLAGNAEPFNVQLGNDVTDVETIAGQAGEPVYYVVRLHPSGFVIVPADDLVEPILSFADGQTYEPSAQDPLTALVTADVNRRLADAYAAGSSGWLQIQSATETQVRWDDLIRKTGLTQNDLSILGLQTISDVRVAPFVQSRWAQGSVCSAYCYNYYTPDHTPCGCAATAMAQLMYYYRCPAAAIGQHFFTIQLVDKEQSASTLGGDGIGGSYRWTAMVASPDCNSTVEQRKAIGALCYDAGVAIGMDYAPDGSGADGFAMAPALKSLFGFSNGISGANNGRDIGSSLVAMINPNLDAGYPVILGIVGTSAHAVLADGYGYDLSTRVKTLYHHLNMGWAGYENIWYNLPNIANYDTVPVCVYNVFTEGTGEIVSGRVTDASGQPIAGVAVRADLRTKRYETVTNDQGIYALTQLPSAGSFTVQADKPGLAFTKQTVETGTSRNRQASTGNKWGIDFIGTLAAESPVADPNTPSSPTVPENTPAEPAPPTD